MRKWAIVKSGVVGNTIVTDDDPTAYFTAAGIVDPIELFDGVPCSPGDVYDGKAFTTPPGVALQKKADTLASLQAQTDYVKSLLDGTAIAQASQGDVLIIPAGEVTNAVKS